MTPEGFILKPAVANLNAAHNPTTPANLQRFHNQQKPQLQKDKKHLPYLQLSMHLLKLSLRLQL